jgi:hypothetical protein
MPNLRNLAAAALVAGIALTACSNAPPPPPPPSPEQVKAAQAAEKQKMYEQLRTTERWELAADIGADIVAKFPGTPAAAEIEKTLPAVKEKVATAAEARRIARIWTYNQVKEPKGVQYTAFVLAAGSPSQEGPDRVRLVLRQHPEWGQSVYLLRDESGFTCGNPCKVSVIFDDEPAQLMPGTKPPTGEPALFIDPDVAFIAKLLKAKKVQIGTQWADQGKRMLEFEVAGLDLSKLPSPPKK